MGFALTVWRVLRCNPFCMGGYNPVPEKGFDRYPVRIPKYTNGQEHREISTEQGSLQKNEELTEDAP